MDGRPADRLKIRSAFVQVDGETRTSMNIVVDNGYVTEILEPGPHISDTQLKEFMQKFASLAEESGLVILSGSAAPGIPTDIYARLIRSASSMGKQVILDTSGELLKEGVCGAFRCQAQQKGTGYIISCRLQDMNDIQKDASSVLLSDGVVL